MSPNLLRLRGLRSNSSIRCAEIRIAAIPLNESDPRYLRSLVQGEQRPIEQLQLFVDPFELILTTRQI